MTVTIADVIASLGDIYRSNIGGTEFWYIELENIGAENHKEYINAFYTQYFNFLKKNKEFLKEFNDITDAFVNSENLVQKIYENNRITFGGLILTYRIYGMQNENLDIQIQFPKTSDEESKRFYWSTRCFVHNFAKINNKPFIDNCNEEFPNLNEMEKYMPLLNF